MKNEELKDLKMVVSSGFTVSEQYSTRKIDSRTSFEIPISVNPTLARALERILQIRAIHDSNVVALESRMISEETFNFSMIPTVFSLQTITQEVSQIKDLDDLTDVEKYYFDYFKVCHEQVLKVITEHGLEESARKLMGNH